MQDKTLQAVIKLRDEMSSQLKIINDNLKAVDKTTKESKKTMKQYSSSLKDIGKVAVVAGGAIVASLGGAFAYSVKQAIEYESAFTGVKKTVNATAQELEAINKGIRDMSTEIPKSASELAGIAEIAGQLGIETKNILSFTKTMAMLSDTTNIAGEEGALQLAKFMNVMGTSQSDVDKLGATIVDLGNNFSTTEADILSMATRLSDLGILANFSETQVLAWSTAMSSVGIEAEMGGTAMKKMVTEIERATLNGGDSLTQFAKIAGVSAKEYQRAFKDDASNATLMFLRGLNNVKQQGGSISQVLDDMGIQEVRLRETIIKLASAHEDTAKALGMSKEAWEENLALSKEAEQRYGTTESQLLLMRNQINNASIDIGNALLPVIRDATEIIGWFANGFSNLDPAIKQTIIQVGLIALGISGLLLVGGGFLMFVGSCISAFTALTGALAFFGLTLSGIMLPITVFMLAIGAIIGTVILVRKAWNENWGGIRDNFKSVLDTMKGWWDSFVSWITEPVNAFINVVKSEKDIAQGKTKRNAYGGRVTRNNELRRLHEGEKILTKQEVSQLDRNGGIGGGITIAKLADTIVVREEADIDKIAVALAKKLKQQRLAFAGQY